MMAKPKTKLTFKCFFTITDGSLITKNKCHSKLRKIVVFIKYVVSKI